jgi:hypothetical protein
LCWQLTIIKDRLDEFQMGFCFLSHVNINYLISQSGGKYNINNNWTRFNQYIGQKPLHGDLPVRVVINLKIESSISIVF